MKQSSAEVIPLRKDDETPTLREATDLRMRLLRQGVQQIRKNAKAAESDTRKLISDGQPGNGLEDALETAARKLQEAEEILGRIEEHQFHRHREG
jgi:hypothetical protein